MKLAIYTRLSREDEQSNSINHQQREGISFAQKNGFTFEVYNEGEGVSGGAPIEDRPQLLKLFTDVQEGKIKAVWFRDQNRLERSSDTYLRFGTLAKVNKLRVFYGDREVNFNDPNDTLSGTIFAALNQYQREQQSVKTKRALKDNIKEGRVWSVVAYGYQKDENGKLTINDKEAEVIKRIFELNLKGIGTRTIAEQLTVDGVPTRKGKSNWAPNTIRNIIKNSIYKGERKYGEETFSCPAIVSPEFWEKVQEQHTKNKNNSGKKVDHRYLFKGLLKCGRCGRNYYGRKRTNLKDNAYICSSKRIKGGSCGNMGINIDTLESILWAHLITNNLVKREAQSHFDNANTKQHLADLKSDIKKYEKQLRKYNGAKDRLIQTVIDGIFSTDDIKSKKNSIEQEITKYQAKISNAKSKIIRLEDEKSKAKETFKTTRKKKLPFEGKREVLKKVIDHVEVDHISRRLYSLKVLTIANSMPPITYMIDTKLKFGQSIVTENNRRIVEIYSLTNDLLQRLEMPDDWEKNPPNVQNLYSERIVPEIN